MSTLKNKWSGISTVIGSVAVINCLLAVVALAKDILFAAYMGTTGQGDALLLAYFVPDTLGNNLLAAAISVSCIPVFSRLITASPARLQNCIKNLNLILLLISAALTVLLYVFGRGVIDNLAAGFTPGLRELSYQLYVIVLPTMLIFSFISTGTALLQIKGSFKVPAAAPVVFNAVFLLAIVFCMVYRIPGEQGVFILAWLLVAAVIVMLAAIAGGLCKRNLKFFPWQFPGSLFSLSREERADIKHIYDILWPYLVTLFCTQGILYFERYLASGLPSGSISALNYAYRITQFPVWVFAAAVITVTFPLMSKLAVENRQELSRVLTKTIKIIMIIALPIMIGIYILRVPVLDILLGRGAFNGYSLALTSQALEGYSLAILGQAFVLVIVRFFLAINRMRVMVAGSLVSALITMIFDYYCQSWLGIRTFGYGALLGTSVNLSIIIFYLVKSRFFVNLREFAGELLKILAAALPVLIFFILIEKAWAAVTGLNVLLTLLYLSGIVIGGAITYYAGLKLTKTF